MSGTIATRAARKAELEVRAMLGAAIAGTASRDLIRTLANNTALFSAAQRDFVLPAISRALQDIDTNDPALQTKLVAINELNAMRNTQILAQLESVAGALNAIGINPVVLKGACHLVTNLWPTPGCRVLRDIDLLVPQEALAAAHDAVSSLAQQAPEGMGDADLIALRKHSEPIRDGSWPVEVEIHHSLLHRQYSPITATDRVIRDATEVSVGSAQVLIPSETDQMLIAAVHGPLGTRMFAAADVHLRDLLDIVFLLRRHGQAIDTAAVQNLFDTHGWGVLGPLTNHCLDRFTKSAGPFRAPRLREKWKIARWNWQIERPWAIRGGTVLWLIGWTIRSLLYGGGARRDTLRILSRPAYIFQRYFRGRSV